MRKVAFLVGNDTFPKDPSIPPLRFTQNDAREFAAVLEDQETCGFETRLYLNRPSQEVLTDLDQISGELGQDDTLLFYYSGHGKLRGNELCLVSNESITASLGATSIRTRLVLEYLQGSLARRRILILDCCHSGAIGRIYKAVDSKSTLDGLADSFGSYILTASTSIELAEEREKDGHGVFTKALIDCLREGPKDRITINDLYDYAHSRLKISAQQTPLFWALQQEGTAVEIGNYQARHERERQQERERLERERQLDRERLEQERQLERERLIATARTRLGAYVTLGELTGEQAEDAVALLKRDEARLFPRERRYRDDIIRFTRGEASFLEVFGVEPSLTLSEPATIDQPVTPPEPAVTAAPIPPESPPAPQIVPAVTSPIIKPPTPKLYPSLNSGLYGGLVGGALAGLLIGVVYYVKFSLSDKSVTPAIIPEIVGFSSLSGLVLGGCIQLIILWFRDLVTEKQYPGLAFNEVSGGLLGGAIGGGVIGTFAALIFSPLHENFVDPVSLVTGSLCGVIFTTLGVRFYGYGRRWRKIGLAFMASLIITACAVAVGILILPLMPLQSYFYAGTANAVMNEGGVILGAVIGMVAGLQVGLTLSVYRLLGVTEQ